MKILIVSADRTLASGHPQNIGDAFLSDALSAALRHSGAEVLIADFGDAMRVESDEQRVRLGGVGSLFRAIRSADAVIFGGGTLLADDQPHRRFAGLPRLAAVVAGATRLAGRPFVIFGVGIDPIARSRAKLAISGAIRAARVWARDTASATRGEELAHVSIDVCGDVSLLKADALLRIAARPTARAGMVLALNRREAAQLTIDDVAAFRERHGTVTFLAMDQGLDADDMALAPAVRAEMSVIAHPQSWLAALKIIGSVEVVVASRMHAMYMGVMSNTPVVAVGAAPKVVAFAEEFGVASAESIGDARAIAGVYDPRRVREGVERVRAGLEDVMTWLSR